MLRGWQHNQHGGPMTVVASLSSTEDAFAVRPQDLETTISNGADPRGWTHLPDPQQGSRPPLGWAEKVLSQGWPEKVRRRSLALSRLHDDAYCSGTARQTRTMRLTQKCSPCAGKVVSAGHCRRRSIVMVARQKAAVSIGSRREIGRLRPRPADDCSQASETRSILLHLGFDGVHDLLHRDLRVGLFTSEVALPNRLADRELL